MPYSHRFSNEVRVGIMFITGLVLLVMVFLSLTQWKQERGTYTFFVDFIQVQGLQQGAEVRVAGVKVGYVSAITLTEKNLVRVALRMAEHVQVHQYDTFTVNMTGLVGERFIEIMPNQTSPGNIVKAGDVVKGISPPDINNILARAQELEIHFDETNAKVHKAADDFINLVGDAQVQENTKQMLANLRVASEHAAELTDTLNQTMRRSQASIALILANVSDVSRELREVSDTLSPQLKNSQLIANLDKASANVTRLSERLNTAAAALEETLGDKQLAGSLRTIAGNLQQASADLATTMASAKTASASLPKITANLEAASADIPKITAPFRDVAPGTAQDVRAIAASLRHTSEQVGNVATHVSVASQLLIDTHIVPEARILGVDRPGERSRSDLNMDLRLRTSEFRAGVTDIGHRSRINLQFGNQVRPATWVRYGLVESSFGLGIDQNIGRNLRLTADLFDPGRPQGNLLVDARLLPIGSNWWLTGGAYGIGSVYRMLGLGIMYRQE